MGFVDGTKPCPPATIQTAEVSSPNPAFHLWTRQDQLLLNAIIGSISPSIIPFIASAKTANDAWTALANTYAKPSRGHIMHLKGVLTNISKGSQSITEFLQHAKSIADELAMLDAPENSEDLTVKILNGLGDEFKDISVVIRAHDSVITFEELHEKLLNFEAVLKQETSNNKKLPIAANYVAKPSIGGNQANYHRHNGTNNRNSNQNFSSSKQADTHSQRDSAPQNQSNRFRPYHGFCQLCGEQGHTAKRCTTVTFTTAQPRQQTNQPTRHWQPRANFAAHTLVLYIYLSKTYLFCYLMSCAYPT